MSPATRYTDLTGCRVPVQQAPMGSVSTAALAVAVAEPAAQIIESWAASSRTDSSARKPAAGIIPNGRTETARELPAAAGPPAMLRRTGPPRAPWPGAGLAVSR